MQPIDRYLGLVFWMAVIVAIVAALGSFYAHDTQLGDFAAVLGVFAGVLLGYLQSRASIKGMLERGLPSHAASPGSLDSDRRRVVLDALLAEYRQVRTTRNLASESAARLFQYFQVALVAAVALALVTNGPAGGATGGSNGNTGPFGLALVNADVRSVLLLATALVLSTLAADVLHWHHDVMTLEDYQERFLRPSINAAVGVRLLRAEEHIDSIRRYEGWSWRALLSLTERSWVDPFVLKELGHVFVLGMAGIVAALVAYNESQFNPVLFGLSAVVGIYSIAVWASFWSVSFQYLAWKGQILRAAWKSEGDQ